MDVTCSPVKRRSTPAPAPAVRVLAPKAGLMLTQLEPAVVSHCGWLRLFKVVISCQPIRRAMAEELMARTIVCALNWRRNVWPESVREVEFRTPQPGPGLCCEWAWLS